MAIIQLVINGVIGAWINSNNLDLENIQIKEEKSNIYHLESGEISYKWRQKEKGGIVEIIDTKLGNSFEYNNGLRTLTLDWIEDGPLYQGKEKPLKVIEY